MANPIHRTSFSLMVENNKTCFEEETVQKIVESTNLFLCEIPTQQRSTAAVSFGFFSGVYNDRFALISPHFSNYTANVYRDLQVLYREIRVRGFQIYGDCG